MRLLILFYFSSQVKFSTSRGQTPSLTQNICLILAWKPSIMQVLLVIFFCLSLKETKPTNFLWD